jgi:hypothetical protein
MPHPVLALLLLAGCQHLALQVTSSSLTVDDLTVERDGASFSPGLQDLSFDLIPGGGLRPRQEEGFVLAWGGPADTGSIALVVPEDVLTDVRTYDLATEGLPMELAVTGSEDLPIGFETLDPTGELVVLYSEGPLHQDMHPKVGETASFEATLDAEATAGTTRVTIAGLHVEREIAWVAVEGD